MTHTPSRQGGVAEGYVLVPREPTQDQLVAAEMAYDEAMGNPDVSIDPMTEAYKAALAAAPAVTGAGEDWLRIATVEGWDSYRGKPTTHAAIAAARSLVGVPGSDGGVQVEWHVDGVDIEIEFNPEGKITEVFSSLATSSPDAIKLAEEMREACAKVAEQHAWQHKNTSMLGPEMNSLQIVEKIRALPIPAAEEG